MKQKELTKTFMMTTNGKKPLVCMVQYKNISAHQGLSRFPHIVVISQQKEAQNWNYVLSIIGINSQSKPSNSFKQSINTITMKNILAMI